MSCFIYILFSNLNFWILKIEKCREIGPTLTILEGMTSRFFSQSGQRYYNNYLLTTSSIARTVSGRSLAVSNKNNTIRTFALSHPNHFNQSHHHPHPKTTTKQFPEAMEAIKQTVAQNLGVSVRVLSSMAPIISKGHTNHILFTGLLLNRLAWRRSANDDLDLGGS